MARLCPYCGKLIKKSEKVCPACGKEIYRKNDREELLDLKAIRQERNRRIDEKVVIGENVSAAKKEQLENQKKLAQDEEQSISKSSEMSKSKLKKLEKDRKTSIKKKQKKQRVHPKPELFAVSKNSDGSLSVNVSDVSFFYEDEQPKMAPKKHDIPEKLKWYDIARWADRMLARRKVKKVANKAATEMPPEVSKATLLVLCIFFGYFGAHNFYAKNWLRGCIVLGCFLISVIVLSINVLQKAVGVSLGGGLGLVFLLCWFLDIFRIIFNKYRYNSSKVKFINTLDFKTRAILGNKYIKKEIEENALYEQQKNQ